MFLFFFTALWDSVVEEDVDWPSDEELSGVSETACWEFPWVLWTFILFFFVVFGFRGIGAFVRAEMKKKIEYEKLEKRFFNRFVVLVKTTFVASKKWHLLVVIILVIVLFVLGIDINSAGLLSLDKNRFNGSVFLSFLSNDHFIRVVGDGFCRHSESSFWCEIRTHHNSHGGMVENLYEKSIFHRSGNVI